jgi:hypothetical protein
MAANTTSFDQTDLTDPALYDDPWAFYAWLRDERPVWFDERSGLYAVSRHADVITASRDTEHFSSAEGVRPVTWCPCPSCPWTTRAHPSAAAPVEGVHPPGALDDRPRA